MADKLRTQQQLEALQTKYIGTGHADMTKTEWTDNIVRDSYASFVGHPPLLYYMSIGMGITMDEMRTRCVRKMIVPGRELVQDDLSAADKPRFPIVNDADRTPYVTKENGKWVSRPLPKSREKEQPRAVSQAQAIALAQAQAQNGDVEITG